MMQSESDSRNLCFFGGEKIRWKVTNGLCRYRKNYI